jgi:response regulator NasT
MNEGEHDRLRILVADERATYLEPITDAVEELGHYVVGHEVEISKVGRATVHQSPDLALVALHEDTDHALELISEIIDEAECPVVVLARSASPEFVAEAARRGVFAHIDSTDPTELQGGIDVAFERYTQYRELLQAFDRRALIERAKGILMERHGISDQEAFERMRSSARSSRRQLIEVVQEVIEEK